MNASHLTSAYENGVRMGLNLALTAIDGNLCASGAKFEINELIDTLSNQAGNRIKLAPGCTSNSHDDRIELNEAMVADHTHDAPEAAQAQHIELMKERIADLVHVEPCDGDHGGPACFDPNCWHGEPSAETINSLESDTAVAHAQHLQETRMPVDGRVSCDGSSDFHDDACEYGTSEADRPYCYCSTRRPAEPSAADLDAHAQDDAEVLNAPGSGVKWEPIEVSIMDDGSLDVDWRGTPTLARL